MTTTTGPAKGILNPALAFDRLSFAFHAPSPDLAAVVDRHWTVVWDVPEPFVQHVLPHPGANVCFEPSGASVHGIITERATHVLEGAGRTFGTMFRPGAFAGYSVLPMPQLVDRGLPLAEVLGPAAPALEDEVYAAADTAGAVAAIEGFLRRSLRPDPDAARVEEIIDWILGSPAGTRVEDVARAHAMTARTLQRLFRRSLGVGPKWVLRRYRLHEAAERIAAGRTGSWAAVAIELGYADQAHFTRDFRSVVGTPPDAYAAICRG